jgi:hypothetical protein
MWLAVWPGVKTPALVDLRNIYKRAEIESQGFVYESVGRL